MIEREEKVSVYIGNGVSFGDGMIAYLVIGIAGVQDEHLEILAKIAIACSDTGKTERLRKAKSKKKYRKY